jgi:phage recombination protein Bet
VSENNGKALALSPAQAPLAQKLELDRERLALLSRTLGTNLKPDELHLFLAVSARLGLDPFTKQIHAIKDGQGRFFLHVGIDGRRQIAQRTGLVDGMKGPFWCGADGEWQDVWLADEPPRAAKVGVLKKGCREPFWAVANLKGFRTNNPNWRERPEHMLAKVAEDHALRKAFPYEMGGIPTAYQPEHDDQGADEAPPPPPESEQHEEGEYREIDQETGEIVASDLDDTPLGRAKAG